MNRLIVCGSLVGLLSACATTTDLSQTQKADAAASKKDVAPQGIQILANVQNGRVPPYKDPRSVLFHKRSVYFEFDDFDVKDAYRPVVRAHAVYLAHNLDEKVRIEGNTDEQGSREYNLALGQKRAHAIKQMMVLFGARESQLEATSWGEERPKVNGHMDSAWSENRRADIKYGNE